MNAEEFIEQYNQLKAEKEHYKSLAEELAKSPREPTQEEILVQARKYLRDGLNSPTQVERFLFDAGSDSPLSQLYSAMSREDNYSKELTSIIIGAFLVIRKELMEQNQTNLDSFKHALPPKTTTKGGFE